MEPTPDPVAVDTGPSAVDVLRAKLHALKRLPYCEFPTFNPTCFDAVGTKEWSGLVGKPIPGDIVHSTVHSFMNIIDQRHGHALTIANTSRRVYGCCNRDCDWKVTFKSKKAASSPWFMQGVPGDHSVMCHKVNTIVRPDVLRNLPELTQFIADCPSPSSVSRAEVISYLSSHGWQTDSISTPSFYRVLDTIRKQIRQINSDEYTKLCRWMRVYQKLNPTATVAIIDDDEGCYFRGYLSIPNGPKIFRDSCQPMFYIDGTFSKTNEYDGTVLTLVALNGNSAVIPLVVATVPAETTSHMAWFIQMCIRAGYPMEDFPIMTDRGNLLAAARALEEKLNIVLNLKFCVEHLIRNVTAMFDLDKDQETIIRASVEKIQQSSYLTTLSDHFNHLVSVFGEEKGCGIGIYLLGIDPVHWIVYANKDICDDKGLSEWRRDMLRHFISKLEGVLPELIVDEVIDSYLSSPVPVGRKFALLFRNRSNPVESEFSGGPQKKTVAITYRDLMPALLIKSWVMRASLVLQRELAEFDDLFKNSRQPWSTVGAALLNDLIEETTKYMYGGTTTENGIVYHYVTHCDVPEYRYKVLVAGCNSYCHCTNRLMSLFLCPHIRVVILHLADNCSPDDPELHDLPRSVDLVHVSYLNESAFKVLSEESSQIKIPSHTDIMNVSVSAFDILQSPPRYQKKRPNGSMKRFKSKGELGAGNYHRRKKRGNRKQYTSKGLLVKRRKVTKPMIATFRLIAASGIFDPLVYKHEPSELTQPQSVRLLKVIFDCGKKKLLHCSECGSEHHTIRECELFLRFGRKLRPQIFITGNRYVVYKVSCLSPYRDLRIPPVELEAISKLTKQGQSRALLSSRGHVIPVHTYFAIDDLEVRHVVESGFDEHPLDLDDNEDRSEDYTNKSARLLARAVVTENISRTVLLTGNEVPLPSSVPPSSSVPFVNVQQVPTVVASLVTASSAFLPPAEHNAFEEEEKLFLNESDDDMQSTFENTFSPEAEAARRLRICNSASNPEVVIDTPPQNLFGQRFERSFDRNMPDMEEVRRSLREFVSPRRRILESARMGAIFDPDDIPMVQPSLNQAIAVFATSSMEMRILCSRRLMDLLLTRTTASNDEANRRAALDYVADCADLDELRDIMLFPSNRYLCNPDPSQRVFADSERMYADRLANVMLYREDSSSLWLCDSIMTCFGCILNALHSRKAYCFGTSLTSVVLSLPLFTDEITTSSATVGSKVMNSKSMKGLSLMDHCVLFFPVNTGGHWICYTVVMEGKKIVVFNPLSNGDSVLCLKPFRHRKKASHSNVAKVMQAVRLRAFAEGVVIPFDECWDTYSYHTQHKIQTDDINCGIYVLLWMRAISKRCVFDGTLDFGSNDGTFARARIVHLFQLFSTHPPRKKRNKIAIYI
jgi:hypothetical protein